MVRLKNHSSSSNNSNLNQVNGFPSVHENSTLENVLLEITKPQSTRPFPNYNARSLKWNETHTLNVQGFYCYCSQDRYLHEIMLQCHSCFNWFHKSCMSINLKNWLPFQLNYIFYCKKCVDLDSNFTSSDEKSIEDSMEVFIPTPSTWKNVVITAIANLLAQEVIRIYPPAWTIANFLKKQAIPSYFIIRDDIVQFIESNWEIFNFNHSLQTEPFQLDTCQANVSCILLDFPDLFRTNTETRLTLSPFTLSDSNLFHLRPPIHQPSSYFVYQNQPKLSFHEKSSSSPTLLPSKRKWAQQLMDTKSSISSSLGSTLFPTPNPVFPSSKPSSSTVFINGPTTSLPISSSTNLISLHSSLRSSAPLPSSTGHNTTIPANQVTRPPTLASNPVTSITSTRWLSPLPPASIHHSHLPTNRDGYKYQLAEPLPCFFEHLSYRACDFIKPQGPGVFLSKEDRHPSIQLMENGLTCFSDQGFRTVRATVGVQQGTWYFEVFIDPSSNRSSLHPSTASHIRLGVCKKEATLLGPVGCDQVGFGYRDRTGDKINHGRLQPYGEPFKPGDVIGVVLHLPPWKAVPIVSGIKDKSMNVSTAFPYSLSSSPGRPVRIQARPYLELLDFFPSSLTAKSHWISIPGSQLVFYKNGVYQGVAFDALPAPLPILCSTLHSNVPLDPSIKDDGTLGYYPALSCYQGGQATINFGPYFMYSFPSSFPPLEENLTSPVNTSTSTFWPSSLQRKVPFKKVVPNVSPYCRPYVDRYFEHAVESCISDMLLEVEAWARSLDGSEISSSCNTSESIHPYKRVLVKWALHEQP